jgi:hypothetical protein
VGRHTQKPKPSGLGAVTLPLAWQIAWQLPQPLKVDNPAQKSATLFQGTTLAFSTRIIWRVNGDSSPATSLDTPQGRTIVEAMAYQFADHEFGMRLRSPTKTEYELYSSPAGFEFVRTRGRAWSLPAPVKCYGFPIRHEPIIKMQGSYQILNLNLSNSVTGCSTSAHCVRPPPSVYVGWSTTSRYGPSW